MAFLSRRNVQAARGRFLTMMLMGKVLPISLDGSIHVDPKKVEVVEQ